MGDAEDISTDVDTGGEGCATGAGAEGGGHDDAYPAEEGFGGAFGEEFQEEGEADGEVERHGCDDESDEEEEGLEDGPAGLGYG